MRQAFRALRLPWHALWLNFKIGLQATLCTWLLVGWGCLIMVFSWNFGWLNSFNKGYEESLVGPLAPENLDDSAKLRDAVQTVTLLALRAVGVMDARARGLVVQAVLPAKALVGA